MPRREKIKKWFEDSTNDVKSLLNRKDRGASRPSTPSPQLQTGSLGGSAIEEAVRFRAREGVTPPATPVVLPSQRKVNDDETSHGNIRPEQAHQPAAPVEVRTSDITGPSLSTAIAGPQTNTLNAATSTLTNPGIPGTKMREQADAVATVMQTEEDEAHPIKKSSTHAPQGTESPASVKWKGLRELSRVLQPVTNLFGPVKEMVDMFVGCVDTYQASIESAVLCSPRFILKGGLMQMAETARVEYDEVQAHLEGLLQDLAGHFSQSSSVKMTKGMESICGSIKEELQKVQTKLGRSLAVRYLEAPDEVDAIVGCYRRIESHLRRLALNANIEMWKVVEEQAAESRTERMTARVDRLPAALPAWYDSAEGIELKRRACTAGTRVDVLANILHWTSSRGEGAVYWLNGMAGTGKTKIAYSACAELDALHHLGASFFCSRLREECRNVNMIIPSIAYQLARFSRPFHSALSKVLENDPDVHGRLPHMQFEALIAKPMLEVQNTLPEGLTVVIDALDECEQKESTARMLDVLLTKSANLPIKFIVSSRPETQIRDQMTEERAKSRLVLHELDKGEVQLDIEKYLREGLAEMSPSDAQIAALVGKAGILFIYAATAVRYIGYDNFQSDPESRLADILEQQSGEGGGRQEIDRLYTAILEAALNNESLREAQRDDMRQVLYTVICAREPLTVEGLSKLLGIKAVGRVRVALRPLWSVLHVVGGSELVTTLHASFPDFMFDRARSISYCCDSNAHHRKLATQCLELIAQNKPQFNVCGLQSSYTLDEKVQDIEKQVVNGIPSESLYACRYWADHVDAASCASSVIEHIRDFLSTRLLLWMEIMNLKNQMKAGMECVKLIVEWCKAFEGEQELAELAEDAKQFVDAFSSNPVSRSTPHIYVSMLAFWPKPAPIVQHYAKYTHGPVVAEGPALDQRQLSLLSTWAFPQSSRVMAISPDGQHVAVTIGKDVLVVDSSSGKVVLGPLQGHPNEVEAVAFSPDGSRILAGSFEYNHLDATILGWDTGSGNTVLGSLHPCGHTQRIRCLNCSSDGSRIAAGSRRRTVYLWDAQTGKTLVQLKAQGSVETVVFSPDGHRVAAGFGKTLQVWDSQSGGTILDRVTISGLYKVDRITLSPDNSRIICASTGNRIIQAGDVQSRKVVFRQIAEQPHHISCIAISPDGKYVASGSDDRAVRIWDIESGNMVLGPLQAHGGAVLSVTFTPDGSRIISACDGGLVCTWDAQHHSLTPNSTDTPSHRITWVKFSSDGTRFVTGSWEGTICIWDAGTGQMVIGPVKVHTRRITAIDLRNDRVVAGSATGKVCVCDARSGEVAPGPFRFGDSEIRSIAYSPDGNMIATGSSGGANVWNAQDGSRVLGPLTDLSGSVSSVQFSPDNTRIVASSEKWGSNVIVWDVSDGRKVFGTFNDHNRCVRSVSCSPNGALIAGGSGNGIIILWDAHTGKRIFGPLTGHSDWVNSVCFSPDSTRLVSGSDDNTIRIWDVHTGKMLFQLAHAHEAQIKSVEYSPDGSRILSRSDDGSVRIHDAQSPAERAQLRSESEVGDWTMDKDGWVVDDQSRLLVWVPGDLRKALMWPSTLQVKVPSQEHLWLRFDKSRMGKSWARSYRSDV